MNKMSDLQEFPKITIVTPSYNQGKFLEETIKSVLEQEYPNLEYIIIDGGSSDNSVEVIKKYSEHLAYWESQPDEGQTFALRKGFGKATGEILGWLCSDDLLESGTLHQVARLFSDNSQLQFIYGDTIWVDENNKVIKYRKETDFNRFIFLYEHNFIPQPSTFWRKDLYQRVGGLNTDFNLAMDSELWLRFLGFTYPQHFRRYWSRMRLYPQQKTQKLKGRKHLEDKILREKYCGSESDFLVNAKRVLAKSTRLSWKVLTGCYFR